MGLNCPPLRNGKIISIPWDGAGTPQFPVLFSLYL